MIAYTIVRAVARGGTSGAYAPGAINTTKKKKKIKNVFYILMV